MVVASRNRKALLQSAEKLEILWCTHSAGDPNLIFPHAYTFPFSVQGRHVSTRKGKGKYENENGQYGEVWCFFYFFFSYSYRWCKMF